MGRRAKYPWAEVAETGRLWGDDFATKAEAARAVASAHNWAWRNGMKARTAVLALHTPGIEEPERWRATAQIRATDADELFAPLLRMQPARGALFLCPQCGAEAAIGICYACEPERWHCRGCGEVVETATPEALLERTAAAFEAAELPERAAELRAMLAQVPA